MILIGTYYFFIGLAFVYVTIRDKYITLFLDIHLYCIANPTIL